MKINIEVEASEQQLYAAAQFLKRVGFSGIEPYCKDKDETYNAQYFLEQIRSGLAAAGYNPR